MARLLRKLYTFPSNVVSNKFTDLFLILFIYLQFISSLKDNLNAEVALGTVTNVKEACAWLGYTYLFIRMRLNPLAYGIGWDEVLYGPLTYIYFDGGFQEFFS